MSTETLNYVLLPSIFPVVLYWHTAELSLFCSIHLHLWRVNDEKFSKWPGRGGQRKLVLREWKPVDVISGWFCFLILTPEMCTWFCLSLMQCSEMLRRAVTSDCNTRCPNFFWKMLSFAVLIMHRVYCYSNKCSVKISWPCGLRFLGCYAAYGGRLPKRRLTTTGVRCVTYQKRTASTAPRLKCEISGRYLTVDHCNLLCGKVEVKYYRAADKSVARPTRKETSYSDGRFWVSYILFIIIIGGMLILYIYIYI
jgi:hypothetical protein